MVLPSKNSAATAVKIVLATKMKDRMFRYYCNICFIVDQPWKTRGVALPLPVMYGVYHITPSLQLCLLHTEHEDVGMNEEKINTHIYTLD